MRPPDSSVATKSVLIRRLRAGDESAFRELLDWVGPQVLRWCRRLNLNECDAQDVFQEAFLAVFSNINTFERRQGSGGFRAWLWTIVSRKAVDHWQKHREILLGEAVEAIAMPPLPDWDADDHNGALWAACRSVESQFTESSWRIFWLTAIEGRTAVDVALDLSMMPEAVRKTKSRVLAAVRTELAFYEGTD